MPTALPDTSSSPSRHTFSWLILIFANVMWATSYVVSKFVLRDLSVTMLLTLRMFIAALVLLPWLIVKRRDFSLTRRDLLQLAFLSLIGFVINKLLEFSGLALATASDVALLITSESLFTAVLSWFLLRERFKRGTLFALLLGLVGVYLIVERSIIPNIPAGGGAWRVIGDLLVILSLLIEALYTVRGKSMLAKHSPLLIISASIVGSTLFWLPVGGWEILLKGWHMPNLLSWLCICWLAIMCTVVCYLAWFQGLSKIDGSKAASTLFLQPLLGSVLAILLLHDELTPSTIFGGMLIIVSVYLISR